MPTPRMPAAPATLEALPRPGRRRGPWRSSIGDPPGREEPSGGGAEPFFEAGEPAPRLPDVLGGVRVLVVDDDPDTADLFATVLTACGADVKVAHGAREALRLLAAEPPDVVVSDIAMPGADGYWLLGEIQRQETARDRRVPVVAVTAFGREHGRARALAAGFAEHLEKPVDPERLCRAVARARGR